LQVVFGLLISPVPQPRIAKHFSTIHPKASVFGGGNPFASDQECGSSLRTIRFKASDATRVYAHDGVIRRWKDGRPPTTSPRSSGEKFRHRDRVPPTQGSWVAYAIVRWV